QQDRRLVHVERLAVPGPGQRPAHGRRGGRAGSGGGGCFGSAGSAIPFRLSDLAITRVAAEITHVRTLRGQLSPRSRDPTRPAGAAGLEGAVVADGHAGAAAWRPAAAELDEPGHPVAVTGVGGEELEHA